MNVGGTAQRRAHSPLKLRDPLLHVCSTPQPEGLHRSRLEMPLLLRPVKMVSMSVPAMVPVRSEAPGVGPGLRVLA